MKRLFYILLASLLFASSCATQSALNKSQNTTAETKMPNPTSYGLEPGRRLAALSIYKTKGTCNGLPRAQIKTAPGFCVGIVDNGEGLIKPRYALQLDAQHILLSDMGGWKEYQGQFYLLTKTNNAWKRSSLLNLKSVPAEKKCILDRPHQITLGPDGLIYLTSAKCIASLDPKQTDLIHSLEIKIDQLPTEGLHGLKAITFDSSGNMYMNVGSKTDVCETETSETCKEVESQDARAVIRKYSLNSDRKTYNPQFTIFTRGQRNSLALYWDEQNQQLWTGENARDYIERVDSKINGLEHPADEMNIISENAVLDWPYCYDMAQKSPEFPKADCSKYQKPHLLFPAHASPLSFLMYTGSLFPAWYKNRLLVSFHGYTVYGHRIVTYKRNDQLQPVGDPLSVIYGWEANGAQAIGSPVGLTQGVDGSVFIVEDNSQKVLQLYYDAKEGTGAPVAELKIGTAKIDDGKLAKDFQRAEEKRKAVFEPKLKLKNVPLFTQIQNQIIDQNCVVCHGGLSYPGTQLLKYDDVGNYKKIKDQILARLKGEGVAKMPPYGLPADKSNQLIELVEKWMAAGQPAP